VEGLAALAAIYLRGAARLNAGDFTKNITPVMARTDFAKMFALHPARCPTPHPRDAGALG
jgi:hypothetical protein